MRINLEKNNKGLYILLGVMFVIILLLAGYILYDKVLSNKNVEFPVENNVVDNDTNINQQRVLNNDEQKGLELYKYFVGDGTGPFI